MLGRAANNETNPQTAPQSPSGAAIARTQVLHQKEGGHGALVSSQGVGATLEDDKAYCAQDIGHSSHPQTTREPAEKIAQEVSALEPQRAPTQEKAVELLAAAEQGLMDLVYDLRRAGARIDGDINTPIASRAMRVAALAGSWDSVEVWIAAGADVNAANTEGATALMIAAQIGHIEGLRLLMRSGSKLDLVNDKGETALTLAAHAGHGDIVKELCSSGAAIPVDLRKKKLEDLERAMASGDVKKTVNWISAGLYIGEIFPLVRLAVTNVASGSQGASRALSKMSDICLNLSKKTGHSSGDFHQVHLDYNLLQSAVLRMPILTKALIGAGARVHHEIKAEAGWALRDAAREQSTVGVLAWILAGADVNAANPDGVTALMWAAMYKDADLIKTVLGAGANLNLQDKDGDTALIYAAKRGSLVATQQLLERGAFLDSTDKSGSSAIHWAFKGRRLEIVNFLLERGAKFTAEQLQTAVDFIATFVTNGALAQGNRMPFAEAWSRNAGLHSLATHISKMSRVQAGQAVAPA